MVVLLLHSRRGGPSSFPLCLGIFCFIRFIHLAEWIYEPKAGSALPPPSRQEVNSFLAECRFKASFPWAKKKEEDHERQYVREHFEKTSSDETAGNLWIHPTDGKSIFQVASSYSGQAANIIE